MTPQHDITWETVTLKPGFEAKAGHSYQQMMSACGRVLVVIGPNGAQVYRRNSDGDYELASSVELT
ncbi:hypothetical protein [Mycobacterium sp. TY814]|uniref:hypothetical protein n=1 Tax=Mycobacterium sp. TY814 TaxID=3050580 RepID=UPI001D7CE058|nr:hypothetical protein [Mycobacterium sp. TY814]MBI2702087.1 hypothetical protein [Mycobacterium sp.]MDP7721767.1 hypothetical protein [Mycobacterium sp. TY814]